MTGSVAVRPPRELHPLRLLAANFALVATIVAFLTVAIRAVIIARLDPVTATGIVSTSGPVNVFVGTLTGDFSGFVEMAFTAFVYWRVLVSDESPPGMVASMTVTTVLVFLACFVGNLTTFILVAADGALLIYYARASMLPARGGAWRISVTVGMMAMALTTVGMFLFSGHVWLPAEMIQLREASVIRGYVLEDDGPWISILRASDRSLVFVPEDDVESREPCIEKETGFEPSVRDVVVDLFSDVPSRPRYPLCS